MVRIATYRTCTSVPQTRSVRNNTTTTAKHIAVIGMSVLGYRQTSI